MPWGCLKQKFQSGLIRPSFNSDLWGQIGFFQKAFISFEAVWCSVQKCVTYLYIRKNLSRTVKINPSFIHLSSWICILVFSPSSFWWQSIFMPSKLLELISCFTGWSLIIQESLPQAFQTAQSTYSVSFLLYLALPGFMQTFVGLSMKDRTIFSSTDLWQW